MNDILQGSQILNDTIAEEIYHPDYSRVTELASEYQDIFTGSGIEPYLRKTRKNQADESFNQLLDIYQTAIPSTVHNLDTIFEKPLRSNRIYYNIDHTSQTAKQEILDKMKAFWRGEIEEGLDAYLQERWKHLVLYDPNAFIAVEFSEFNPIKEKPTPFAIEYSSTEARNYAYIRGVLDWLIIEKEIFYPVRSGDTTEYKPGSKFIMYLENDAIQYTEVDPVQRNTDIENPVFVEIRKNPKSEKPDRVFVVQLFNTNSGVVPAFRVGYLQDPESVSLPRTCLSNIHYALAFFKKELVSDCELDLTIRAHVFPKTYMYGPKCQGDKERDIPPCMNGKGPNGQTCQACGGSGIDFPVHTTSTDLIIVPIPKKEGEPVIDLTKAFAQFGPPVDLIRFMVEYVDRLTEKAKGAVFPSQAIATSQNRMNPSGSSGPTNNVTTATQQDYSWDSVYDAYRPFTGKYSYAWLFITKMIATYLDDLEGFSQYHKFPNDYKLKPVSVLMTEKSAANTASLPQHILKALDDDIANIIYADDPDTLTKIQIKTKFHPFSGKAEAEIMSILSSPDVLQFDKVLYINFDKIFVGIDEELGDRFYLMPYEKQKAEVEARVTELITELDAQKLKSFQQAQSFMAGDPNNPNPLGPNDPNNPTNPNNPSGN